MTASRTQLVGESTEQFIMRRAHEIHMEEAEINDPFISDEGRAYRLAKSVGLVTSGEMLSNEE